MDEKPLIKKAQKGDKKAFEALLLEYYDVMFKMAFKWCGNREDAEDITQNACMKLARSLNSFKFQSSFTTWLYTLVINTGKDMYRQKKPNVSLEAEYMGSKDAEAETKLFAKEVMEKVFELPENERTAIMLVMSDGYTHKEAAQIMACKESTVSWYIHEARKKLLEDVGAQSENKGEKPS